MMFTIFCACEYYVRLFVGVTQVQNLHDSLSKIY